jgi:putative ABC transport system ATP-binding protein
MPPVSRLLAMIRLDSGDIGIITLFALVIGLLGLATPLAVESLVNTVVFGRYVQPIIILSLMLFVFLMFSGFLRILQSYAAEIIQRRMMVRVVGDLANRIPRANIKQWDTVWGPELTNRFFDVLTLQKSVSTLFVDGISLIMQTIIGLALLGFYHPFLLGFDIVLVACVVVIILVLGRGGIKTAENESIVKYKVAHWLQDLAGATTAFKIHGGRQLAVDRANRLMGEYVAMRSRHFRVLLRQNAAGMILYAVASTALLGLGGWLVVQGRLSPGQLVAAELIVTVILGSFMKIGKQVETFFDLTAGVNKLGHLLDLETDPPGRLIDVGTGPAPVHWTNLAIEIENTHKEMHFEDYTIEAGETVAIVGPSGYGKSLLAEALVGMRSPCSGYIEIEGIEAREASRLSDGGMAAMAGGRHVFHGTVAENIHLGRPTVTDADVRESLRKVLAWDEVLKLPEGMETPLLTGGRPLSSGQIDRLMIARAIAGSPRVLILDGALDALPIDVRQGIWNNLTNPKTATIIVITNEPDIIQRCDKVVSLPGVGGSGVVGKLDSSHAFA